MDQNECSIVLAPQLCEHHAPVAEICHSGPFMENGDNILAMHMADVLELVWSCFVS